MSNSDAILYTLILLILNILFKIWFPRIDLKLFKFRGTALTTFGILGHKPFYFHNFGTLAPSSPYVEPPLGLPIRVTFLSSLNSVSQPMTSSFLRRSVHPPNI